MDTSFYLLVMGSKDKFGRDHGQFETCRSIWESFETNWNRLEQVETSLRRYKACYDRLQGILIDFKTNCVAFETCWVMLWRFDSDWSRWWTRSREFGPVVYDSRRVGALWMSLWWVKVDWRRLRQVETRKRRLGRVVSIGWAEMRRPLWVRHICCTLGEVSRLGWRLVKSDGTSALICDEWRRSGDELQQFNNRENKIINLKQFRKNNKMK